MIDNRWWIEYYLNKTATTFVCTLFVSTIVVAVNILKRKWLTVGVVHCNSQSAFRCFFVFIVHILGSFPHGVNYFIQRYFCIRRIGFKGKLGSINCLDCTHQIRSQLSAIGSPIKGDLKYGFDRSNPDGGIHLHARKLMLTHPVTKESLTITAPVPQDTIWQLAEK